METTGDGKIKTLLGIVVSRLCGIKRESDVVFPADAGVVKGLEFKGLEFETLAVVLR